MSQLNPLRVQQTCSAEIAEDARQKPSRRSAAVIDESGSWLARVLLVCCAGSVGPLSACDVRPEGRSGERWGFIDGSDYNAPWHWADSELQCYRDLAARREYERKNGRSADLFGINCVQDTWSKR
jgi:hypothetical protein